MLGHQFGQDLVLGLHLLLQELDPFLLLLDLRGGTFLHLEGGRSVLKPLLLPATEDGFLFPHTDRKPGPCLKDGVAEWPPSL